MSVASSDIFFINWSIKIIKQINFKSKELLNRYNEYAN